MQLPRSGVPLVVSAPSGTGKTTLCRRLVATLPDLKFSVSTTTRRPRANEQDGVDYDFVDDKTFQALIDENAFVEWAQVHGRRYGTRRSRIEAALARGEDVLFDIDVQGARMLQAALPEAVLVHVAPPSLDALAERLRRRSSDSAEQVQQRLAVAEHELRDATFYTHWVVNEDLEVATQDLLAIMRAERLRRIDHAALLGRVLGHG